MNSGKFIWISLYSIFKGLFINDVVLIIKKILVILEFIILLKIILEEFWYIVVIDDINFGKDVFIDIIVIFIKKGEIFKDIFIFFVVFVKKLEVFIRMNKLIINIIS